MDTQAIRKKILDLALRGKLTEQLPEDGTAEELYRQIQQKNHSKPIKEKINNEKPFEIPENWEWVHLNEIADTSLGKTLDKSKNSGELCPYLCSINVHWDGIKLDTVKEARFTEEEKTKYKLAPGDLLICEGGDVGRTAIWNQNTVMYYQNALHRVRFHCNINPWFYRDLFEYYKAIGLLDWFSTGMTIKHLVQSSLYSLWLPLPPLSEQKRIVDKVDSMIAILNTIDALQSQYQDNLATLKSKIIDAGIQGKLTEQLPEDGTAEELYRQIQAEKVALEKAGKIKKNKPLAPVAEEEKPFEVPVNWMWVRFSDLMLTISTGPFGSMLHKSDYVNNGIPLVNPMNIVDGKIIPSDKMMVSEESRLRLASYVLHEGMIVMGRRGEMGRCAIVNQNENGWLCGTGSFFMKPSNCILVQYVIVLLSTIYAKTYLGGQSIGMTMSNLNHTILTKMPVPLPPLAEQKRIVAKLEELLPLCEG